MFVDESVVFVYFGHMDRGGKLSWKTIVLEKVDLAILWTDSNTVLLEKYM